MQSKRCQIAASHKLMRNTGSTNCLCVLAIVKSFLNNPLMTQSAKRVDEPKMFPKSKNNLNLSAAENRGVLFTFESLERECYIRGEKII